MNNKEKCEELRKLRVKIAEDLGKPELVRNEPCNFTGECSGTCPACYKEEEVLMKELYNAYENDNAFIVSNRKVPHNQEDMNDFETDFENSCGFGSPKIAKPTKESGDSKLPIFTEFNPYGSTSVTRTSGKIDIINSRPCTEEPPINRLGGVMIPSFEPIKYEPNKIEYEPNKEYKKPEKKEKNKKKLFSKRSKK